MRTLATGIFIIALTGCSSLPKQGRTEPARTTASATQIWVQLGANGDVLAKALAPVGPCPALLADGKVVPMSSRGDASEAFSGLVCEARVPDGAGKISVNEQTLALPKANPKRILILGDTGCRITEKSGKLHSQNCNSATEWPFGTIAQAAARWKPDLVVHVGDYHYREAPCPEGNMSCSGAASGDNWQSWQEDFFVPALPLLRAAPWIFARGNHELCSRAGEGWFKFLDPRPYNGTCLDHTDPYWVNLGDRQIGVIDAADDANIQPSLNSLKASPDLLTWLTLHRPFLTPGADDERTAPLAVLPPSLREQISLVLAGHQHHLSLNQFSDSRPLELISGNGGTELEKRPSEVDPRNVYRESSGFGFLTFEREDGNAWKVIEHDSTGAEVLVCQLLENRDQKSVLRCSP